MEVHISQEQIAARVRELGEQINRDYEDKEIVVVGVLTGAFMFCADLIREIKVPVKIEFMSAASYGDDTESSGNVKIRLDLKHDIKDKHVLVVEDIVDTGLTITSLLTMLKARHPASIRLASLLHKPARSIHKVHIDYLAFKIEDNFVIGYGLDYAERYRELPYIGIYQG